MKVPLTFLSLTFLQLYGHLSDCNRTWTHNHLVCKQTKIWPVWLNGRSYDYELSGCGFESCFSLLIFRYQEVPAMRREFINIQVTSECRFTLNVYVTWYKHTVYGHLYEKFNHVLFQMWSIDNTTILFFQ